MDPVTHRIRGNRPSDAQIRALRLAAKEGALCIHRGRWAPPSRASGQTANTAICYPYESSQTVFALERRGLMKPDPRYARGAFGDVPRPRVITEAGRALLASLEQERVSSPRGEEPDGVLLANDIHWDQNGESW